MFSVDLSDVKRMEKRLALWNRKAFPFAVREVLNGLGFGAQRIGRKQIGRKMIERNKWTSASVQVDKVAMGSLRISEMEARTGSVEAYMQRQEMGGANEPKEGRDAVRIPTSVSSGEGENAVPRLKAVRKPNRMAQIQLRKSRKKGANRRQKNLIAVKQAAKDKKPFAFLKMGKRKGIFKITGSPRNPRVKLLHDLSKSSTPVPRNPWLRPASNLAAAKRGALWAKALRFQLERIGLR